MILGIVADERRLVSAAFIQSLKRFDNIVDALIVESECRAKENGLSRHDEDAFSGCYTECQSCR
jgi:hypothetical protein